MTQPIFSVLRQPGDNFLTVKVYFSEEIITLIEEVGICNS